MNSHEPLTAATVLVLAEIIQAVRAGATVMWFNEHGDALTGVARHLVTNVDTAAFAGPDDDIRDTFLRISGMFEHFLPLPEVLAKLASDDLAFRIK